MTADQHFHSYVKGSKSSFMLSNEALCQIAKSVVLIGIWPWCEMSVVEAAHRLHELNKAGLQARYGKSEKVDRLKMVDAPPIGGMALYKQLKCLLYQANEGNVPNRHVYRWVQEALISVGHKIISNLPGYEELPWGD